MDFAMAMKLWQVTDGVNRIYGIYKDRCFLRVIQSSWQQDALVEEEFKLPFYIEPEEEH